MRNSEKKTLTSVQKVFFCCYLIWAASEGGVSAWLDWLRLATALESGEVVGGKAWIGEDKGGESLLIHSSLPKKQFLS